MACSCGPGQQCEPLKPGCWGYDPPLSAEDEAAVRNDYTICLMDCARVIEDEIGAGATQPEVAKTYALAMFSAANHAWEADWPRVNRAIINRWSMTGLERVKKLAHQSFRPAKKAEVEGG